MLVIAAVIVITLVVGIWFFLLRGGGTNEFLTAHERVVTAVDAAEGAFSEVELFSELETFDATISTQRGVLKQQLATFDRLASEKSGDDARLATDASTATVKVLVSLDSYAAGVLDRRLADAAFSLVQMREGLAALDAAVAEWENLQ